MSTSKHEKNPIICMNYLYILAQFSTEMSYWLPRQWKWWIHWLSLCLFAHSEGKGGYGYEALHCPWPQICEPKRSKERQ